MKSLIALIIPFLFSYSNPSEISNYEKAMLEQIQKIYQVQDISDYQQIINVFDRIAAKENDKWEPLYYSGYGYAMLAARSTETEEKDKYLDLGLEKVKQGIQLVEQESELLALEGFIYMIRLSVDPATRGQQYAGMSMTSFGKAVAANPENPRAIYLMGQMKLGTAKFFGGDTSEACSEIKGAIEKFDTYKSDNVLAPQWGKGQAISAAKQCEE